MEPGIKLSSNFLNGNGMRQRKVSVSASTIESEESSFADNQIYNRKRVKKSTCCLWVKILLSLLLLGGIYYAVIYRNTGIGWLEYYERDDGGNNMITNKQVPLEDYQTVQTVDRVYSNWNHYVQSWHRCADIVSVSPKRYNGESGESLVSGLIHYMGPTFIRSYFQASTLLESQKLYMLKYTNRTNPRGNFTIPTMYMKQTGESAINGKAVFPCICTIRLEGGDSSDSMVRREYESGIIHMINPEILEDQKIHTEDKLSVYSQVELSMNLISTFRERFWMNIPHHLNVSFRTLKNAKLEDRTVLFTEAVNVVNLVNCIHLLHLESSPLWKLEAK
jgi:hypothetical protein